MHPSPEHRCKLKLDNSIEFVCPSFFAPRLRYLSTRPLAQQTTKVHSEPPPIKMGKKKRGHPDVEDILGRPWCYYCASAVDRHSRARSWLTRLQANETLRI